MVRYRTLAFALWAALLGCATFSPAQEQQQPGSRTLADCAEATNGCTICRYDSQGEPRCSLPGIACQPSGWRCIKPTGGAADSGAAPRIEPR